MEVLEYKIEVVAETDIRPRITATEALILNYI